MDLFRVHAQVVQLVMKMLLAVVATALFLVARLVLPLLRSAVVALVRFPAVVADRYYEPQRAEVEALLLEARRATRTMAPAPVAELAPSVPAMSDSEGGRAVGPKSDGGHAEAVAPAPTAEPAPEPEPQSEAAPGPTPMPEPGEHDEVDEGPVLRYRPKQAPGD